MSTAAVGGASTDLASILSAGAAKMAHLDLVEAQISASQALGGSGASAPSSSAQAPGSLQVYA